MGSQRVRQDWVTYCECIYPFGNTIFLIFPTSCKMKTDFSHLWKPPVSTEFRVLIIFSGSPLIASGTTCFSPTVPTPAPFLWNWQRGKCVGWQTAGLRACVCVKLLQSCLTVCDSMDCSPASSSVHGDSPVRILEWVAVPSSRESSQSGIEPESLMSPALADRFLTTSATCKAWV